MGEGTKCGDKAKEGEDTDDAPDESGEGSMNGRDAVHKGYEEEFHLSCGNASRRSASHREYAKLFLMQRRQGAEAKNREENKGKQPKTSNRKPKVGLSLRNMRKGEFFQE